VVTVNIVIQFHENVAEKFILDGIWSLLQACNTEFVPPLSTRESSCQRNLANGGTTATEPREYFNMLREQAFLLAVEPTTCGIAGFMSFRHNYECLELAGYQPGNYVTTICVNKDFRNQGITRLFYREITQGLPLRYKLPYVSTRTWSSNDAHIHLLEKLEFSVVARLKDHRGPGIDTIYFAKKVSDELLRE
jgi:ribosomal protein S18 acetylase RimI-like enzyme